MKPKNNMTEVNIIVAVSEDNKIGSDNKMLWHIREDMMYFSGMTKGHVVVMGRKTFDSIGSKPLKDRTNIVFSRGTVESNLKTSDNLIFMRKTSMLMDYCKRNGTSTIFIIGGRDIYKLFLEDTNVSVKNIYYTRVFQTFFEVEKPILFPDECVDWRKYYLKESRRSNSSECEFLLYSKKKTDMENTETKENTEDMEHEELQYLKICTRILQKKGNPSIFGETMKFNLQEGFPILTSKKIFFKGIVHELLWFLSGSTNTKILSENGVRIWEANSSREYLDSVGLINNEENELGPIYGFQMRNFGGKYDVNTNQQTRGGIDQIKYIIETIKTNPSSRRIIMSLWNPTQMYEQALPPCHVLYQFKCNEEDNTLDLCMYQRSGDMGLGVPFNIGSSSLLLSIIAKLTKRKVGVFTHFLGDCHIYKEHIESLRNQIRKPLYPFPILEIKDRNQLKIEDFIPEDFILHGYRCNKTLKMSVIV